jgi:hypothetical protein
MVESANFLNEDSYEIPSLKIFFTAVESPNIKLDKNTSILRWIIENKPEILV